MIRSLTRAQLVVDIVVAALLFLVSVRSAWSDSTTLPFVSAIVVALFCGALALRRLSPAVALIGVWAAAVLQIAVLLPATTADLAVIGVAYATGSYGDRTVRWLGLGSAVVGGLIAAFYVTLSSRAGYFAPAQNDRANLVLILVIVSIGAITVFGLSWTLGLLARTIRLSREAKIQAAVAAQRASYESAVEQERTSIARDMHDVVAHSLAVVIAQADGARYAGANNPEVQADALSTISATARSALTEVRLLLSQLRQSAPDGPQPSLDDLPALVAGMRHAGLRITESVTGTPLPLLQGTGMAAYRIVQEALTNALRHGDPVGAVELDVSWELHAVRVRVRNPVRREAVDGAAQAPAHAGHGVPGMRERAALAGGTLAAGAAPGGHYEVIAVLPVTTTSPVGRPAAS